MNLYLLSLCHTHTHTHTRWAQVVVIEKGCVVEQGTHDELLAQGGVYKQLVLRQLTAGDIVNGQLTSSDENHHKTE